MRAHAITVQFDTDEYVLINYKEIISFYQKPWYKRLFQNAPIKELEKRERR